MSDMLDDLARSLARPMSRRRALRLAVGALVGAALPLASVRRAFGAVACTPEPGGKLCACPSINGLFYKVCCPPPADDWDCQCKAPPGGYAACVPKKVKRCGPDVTDELESTLSRVKSAFGTWSGPTRYAACVNLVTLPGAAVSWDISELGPGGRERLSNQFPDCNGCGSSVQVGTGCHYTGSVNYVVYGVMMRLCHDYLSQNDSSIADWFTMQEMQEMIYIHKSANVHLTQGANFAASTEWANAGYQSGSVRPTPPGDRDCKERCPDSYSGKGFTVRWLPEVIRP